MTPLHPQVVAHGLATGAIYGLMATGMQLILGSTGKVHLGVGQATVLAALALSLSCQRSPLPIVPTMLGVFLAVTLMAHVSHPPGLWRKVLAEGSDRAFLLITLGAALALEALTLRIWPLPVTASWPAGAAPCVWGVCLVWPKAMAVVVSASAALAVGAMLRWSKRGKALRAWDMGTAELGLVGVDPHGLGRWATTLGLGVAAVAGVLVGSAQVVRAQDWLGWSIKALCLAVLGGGLGPLRTMTLGWALGIGEAWVSQWIGPQWHPALAPALVPIALRLRSRKGG